MKQLALDRYATLDSPIHRWEPRTKFVGLMALIFAFSAIQDWRLLPVMYAATIGIFLVSALPSDFLASRLKLPGYFIAFLIVLLPFISGTTELLRVGPLALRQEGLENALLIASRFLCIVTLTLVLLGTAPLLTSIKALRALGLPEILADMILLTYRYLFEMADTLQAMRTAVRLRGFDGSKLNWSQLSTLAALIGTLLVRSYEQAEQVYKAMVLRGYGLARSSNTVRAPRRGDIVSSIAAVTMAVALVSVQFYMNR